MGPRYVPPLLFSQKSQIAKNSATTKTREKIFGIHKSLGIFDVCWTKFINNQILLNKISHRNLRKTKILNKRKILTGSTIAIFPTDGESSDSDTVMLYLR